MEAIRGDYEREYGVPLHVQYGPSQTLLAGLKVSSRNSYFSLSRSGISWWSTSHPRAKSWALATKCIFLPEV
jgi:hypothetical protein